VLWTWCVIHTYQGCATGVASDKYAGSCAAIGITQCPDALLDVSQEPCVQQVNILGPTCRRHGHGGRVTGMMAAGCMRKALHLHCVLASVPHMDAVQ
jgi:hypothetical protein